MTDFINESEQEIRFIELEIGKTYKFCKCGKSKNKPFCDESHVGTSFEPVGILALETRKYALCTCGNTKKFPFCDGSCDD